jgi:transposase
VVLDAEGAAATGQYPACGTSSTYVHEHYTRRPVDSPWRGRKARLLVRARRFRCLNDLCGRRTFVEDFGEGLPRCSRRTSEATELLLDFALKAGGEKGSRLAGAAGLHVSPDTLLRLIRRLPLVDPVAPRVLGVDDLALRRGYSYATLLVDLESHRPIDLLKDRDAETLAGWLKAHPGVEVISRDRAEAYAEGASSGAPDAIQVADRFHLLQNATDALDGMLRGRRLSVGELQSAMEEPDASPMATSEARLEESEKPSQEGDAGHESAPVDVSPEPPPSPTKRYLQGRREAGTARWERVRHLHEVGVSISQIGREVGITRKTVRSLLATRAPPRNRVARPRPEDLSSPTLAPYANYLQDRWQQGCTDASRLFREIEAKGYEGSRTLLIQAVRPWRGPKPPKLPKKERDKAQRMNRRTSMRWICLKPPDRLKDDERMMSGYCWESYWPETVSWLSATTSPSGFATS